MENQGATGLAIIFNATKVFPMARGGKPGKKKTPRTSEELLLVEDQLQQIQSIFRDIRNEMRENQVSTVELALGTVQLYVEKMKPLVEKFYGEFRSQLAVEMAKRARERVKASRQG